MIEKLLGHSFLIAPGKGKNHPPMAALKVAMPGATAFGLQELFLRPTEGAQIGVAGDNNFTLGWCRLARIGGSDWPDKMPVSGFVGNGLAGIKTGIEKELPGCSSNDTAMMSVVRTRLTTTRYPFAVRIEIIFPKQIVGVGEGVLLKIEFSKSGNLGLLRCDAAAQKRKQDEQRSRAQSSNSARYKIADKLHQLLIEQARVIRKPHLNMFV